ncbi:MAG TPA: spore germination protein GerW family protein [Actinomycetota bacterium]|nr:spore germination protein GerW family protein [Actinomycetota bacterium]
MQVQDVIAQARDTLTVKRVFGEPYERNGLTVIPVARVQGGGGGGSGESPDGTGSGSGGGFGMSARPVGAFVIRDGEMTWRPAVDVTRIVLGAQVVAVVALLTLRRIVKIRSKARS